MCESFNDIFENFTEFGVKIRIPNPRKEQHYAIRFVDSEFTSVCPITNQPDFAHVIIDYIPDEWLIESSALKKYLNSFGDQPVYQEDCIITIGLRLVDMLKPHWLRIGGYWYPRGGMPIDVFWQTGEPPKSIWIPEQNKPQLIESRF